MRTGEFALERTDAGLAVLTISGEHDLSTAPDLRQRLDHLIGTGDPIVVDLSPATFIDSSILGVILDCKRRANDGGIGFEIAQADGADAVRRVLDVTGLREELPVHGARDDAASVASANGRGDS